jgi:hypothetical protein
MDELISSYLRGEAFACPQCSAQIDYWSLLLESVKADVFSTSLISLIAGYSSVFSITLEKGKVARLDLSEYGIPKDAQLYRMIFTAIGDGSEKAALFPGTGYVGPLPEHTISPIQILWPTPGPYEREPLDRNDVNVLVTWAPHSGEDDIKQILVDALFAIGRSDLRAAIVWANVAVETAVYRLIQPTLEQIVGSKRAKNFLQDAATYSHQLNVVLPLMLHRSAAPTFPPERLGNLNRLRRLRNDLAHSASGVSLDRDEVLTCLCAAVLFVHYFDLIKPNL